MSLADIIREFGGLTPLMAALAIIALFIIRDIKGKKAIADTDMLKNTMILINDPLGERIATALESLVEMKKAERDDRQRAEHDRKIVEQFKKDQGMKA